MMHHQYEPCKHANCLIKNLLEIDSLPQLRNLLEMSESSPRFIRLVSGEKDEANDEGEEARGGADGRTLPPGTEEGESSNPKRACGVDWLHAELPPAGPAQSRPPGPGAYQGAGSWSRAPP